MAAIDYKQKIKDYMNSSEVDTLYKSMLNNLFPELKESKEDEMIRVIKEVILNSVPYKINILTEDTTITAEEAIAWLEKQGETFTKKDVDDAYLKGIFDTKQELEKQGKQKPTDLPKGEDYGIDGLYAAIDILQKTLGEVDGYQSDDGILEHKCAITAVKKLYEQKSAAWSEEDDTTLLDTINILCSCGRCSTDRKLWLLSLRERVQSTIPVKKK